MQDIDPHHHASYAAVCNGEQQNNAYTIVVLCARDFDGYEKVVAGNWHLQIGSV